MFCYNSFMSRIPRHSNTAQAVLHHLGQKEIGAESTNVLPDHEVRKKGFYRLVKNAGKTAAVGALGVVSFHFIGEAIDNSPTQVKFRQDIENQNTTTTLPNLETPQIVDTPVPAEPVVHTVKNQ